MMFRFLATSLSVVCVVLTSGTAAAADPATAQVKVIVHESNPATQIEGKTLSDMLLGKETRWPNGWEVLPIDLAEDNEVREALSQMAHGRGSGAIKNYWTRMIFSGQGVPPPEVVHDDDVFEWVRLNTGALGYVNANTPLGPGVKVIDVK